MGHARKIESFRWPLWLHPIALLLVSWVWIAALTLRAHPGDDVVAAVFPPWWSAADVFAAAASAGAAIVRVGGVASVLVVQPAARDGLQRLRDAGAWFVVNPQAVGAC